MLSALIAFMNSAADHWASWMFAASLDAALLFVLVSVVWIGVRNRVASQVGYCLFLLVPLKLLTPVVVPIPSAVARWTPVELASSCLAEVLGSDEETSAREPGRSIVSNGVVEPGVDSFGAVPTSTPALIVAVSPQPSTSMQPMTSPTVATTVSAPMPAVDRVPDLGLSATAIIMLGWLAGVLGLLGRLVVQQRRLRRAVRRMTPMNGTSLAVDLSELRERSGVCRPVRLLEGDGVSTPSVVGIIRPAILLPRGIADSLTPEQLRWVLLHELSHIRNRDLIVVVFQRIAAILYFFNPTIWLANRMIHQLREYRCDDVALALSDAPPIESGEAFVNVLRHARNSWNGLEGGLGIFGLDARSCTLRRARRLLDVDRPIRGSVGAFSITALLCLAAVTTPHLRASGSPRSSDEKGAVVRGAATVEEPKFEEPIADVREFALTVVGPDGQSIPKAEVEFRSAPSLTADHIRRGAFVSKHRYGSVAQADDEGRITVEFPPSIQRVEFFVTIPGYGPYWDVWDHSTSLPPVLTAELDAAWSVGGVIDDDEGNPVEGARIRPHIRFKTPPGNPRDLYIGAEIKSDLDGRWRYDSVPDSMSQVHVEVDHPNYESNRRSLTQVDFGLDRDQAPMASIKLESGLTVTGTITDEAGAPIEGAFIYAKFVNDIRETVSGPDGAYKLIGCEPQTTRIVAYAKGRATEMKEVDIESGMAPADFSMKPGGTVRIRVVDSQGTPVAKTRIFFQRWRGPFQYFEFKHVNEYADDNGVWVWNEAPLDEFQADVCPPGGMQLLKYPLISREDEYLIQILDPLVISGRVVDAATKNSISDFRVVPGIHYTPERTSWELRDSFQAGDGRFEYRPRRAELAHLIRIEADGYQAAVTRPIKSDERNVSIDVELNKGVDVAATVVTANGVPAVGARIALGIAGSQISLKNGDIDDASTYAARAETNADGRFHFPAQGSDFQLVITHPEGFAHMNATPDWDPSRVIRLEPWCRVEGVFRIGKTPTSNIPLVIQVPRPHSYGPDVPNISSQYEATTGSEGEFIFERVVPDRGAIGRRIDLPLAFGSSMSSYSRMIPQEFPSGETVRLELGGGGRAVVGSFRLPEDSMEKPSWNYMLITLQRDGESNILAVVDAEGRFHLDDVPPGAYRMVVARQQSPTMVFKEVPIVVSPIEGDAEPEPVDLGILPLLK